MGRSARTDGARRVAARVLERVDKDDAFAAAALDAELERAAALSDRDRALATRLVYGVLRHRDELEARLKALAPKGIAGGDRRVLIQLLLAGYQLLGLDRVPAHAAVDTAVESVRRLRGPRVAGFANAVLRKLASTGPLESEQRAPEWLRAALVESVGEQETDALLAGDAEAHGVDVRSVCGRADQRDWFREATPGCVSPLARRVVGRGDPRRLPGWDEGELVVQEEGAQLIALALGARPGERVLDACAGRGQKSSLLVERVGPSGEVWVADAYPAKLDALREEIARLALPAPHFAAVDWTAGTGAVPDGFDRVLVDAPCTGTGTLRRRPEIMKRLGPDDPERMAALAEQIARAASSRAKPGGRVVYAVCSVLRAEGEAVCERLADVLEPVPFDAPEVVERFGADCSSFRLLPAAHGTDGYFVASFVRR